MDGEADSRYAQLTDGKRSNIGIRFKSFQKLKTDLNCPRGFEPELDRGDGQAGG